MSEIPSGEPKPILSHTRQEAVFSFAYQGDRDPAGMAQAAMTLIREMDDEEIARIRKAAERLLQWLPLPRSGS